MRFKGIIDEISKLEGYNKPKIYKDKLKLDTNENIAIPKRLVARVISKASKIDAREYPINYDMLKSDLAKYLNVKRDCIAIGNGSDQIIDLLLSIGRDTKSITIKPTFSFYIARCRLYSLSLEEISLDDNFGLDYKKVIDSDADILYLCSPNNPTGNQFPREEVINIIESFKGFIIIDEAYAEFARYSLKDIINKYDNLIIIRTMSKAFGLAGLRIGYAIANPSIIDVFNRVIQYPYPVNSIAVNAARIMLSMKNEINNIITTIKKERERVYDAINSSGLSAYRSDANFIAFSGSKKIFNGLLRNGIIVKDLGEINGKQFYRVSIGNKDTNDRFINALRKVRL